MYGDTASKLGEFAKILGFFLPETMVTNGDLLPRFGVKPHIGSTGSMWQSVFALNVGAHVHRHGKLIL
jgi:hypothetical protein